MTTVDDATVSRLRVFNAGKADEYAGLSVDRPGNVPFASRNAKLPMFPFPSRATQKKIVIRVYRGGVPDDERVLWEADHEFLSWNRTEPFALPLTLLVSDVEIASAEIASAD